MITAPPEAWRRLGRLLIERRVQLDPDYRSRTTFAERVRLDYRVLFDIEKAKRTNFKDETLAAIEVAYRIASGSIRQALEDPSLSEFPHRLGGTVLAVSSGDSGTVTESATVTKVEPLQDPGDLGPNVYFGSLDRWEQELLTALRDFPPEVRMRVLAYAQGATGERLPETLLGERRNNSTG